MKGVFGTLHFFKLSIHPAIHENLQVLESFHRKKEEPSCSTTRRGGILVVWFYEFGKWANVSKEKTIYQTISKHVSNNQKTREKNWGGLHYVPPPKKPVSSQLASPFPTYHHFLGAATKTMACYVGGEAFEVLRILRKRLETHWVSFHLD